jgi:hypothetical protein
VGPRAGLDKVALPHIALTRDAILDVAVTRVTTNYVIVNKQIKTDSIVTWLRNRIETSAAQGREI